MFATKVAPEIQGRVMATRSMISQSIMPIAFLLSGFLADHVFNPLLVEGGKLANTFVGRWIGVGPTRGIGLMLITSGSFIHRQRLCLCQPKDPQPGNRNPGCRAPTSRNLLQERDCRKSWMPLFPARN